MAKKKPTRPDYFQWTRKEKARLKALTQDRVDRGWDAKKARRLSIVDLILDRQREKKESKKKKKKD